MKTRLVLLLTLITAGLLTAQVEWKGGFPGRESDWFCAGNWNGNRIPNHMDQVVIPDCSTSGDYCPVIRSDQPAQVKSVELLKGALLTVDPSAQLTVLGYNLAGGALLNRGKLENNGTLEVIEPILRHLEYTGGGTLIHCRSNLEPDVCQEGTCF